MSLFFCAIANEKSIVCKHAIANRDFSNIVESYLSRQVAEGHLFYSEQNVGVHALKVSGISFIAVTELQTPRQQPVQFLTELATNFASKSARVEQARTGQQGCLQHSYGGTLKTMMGKFADFKSNLQMAALQSNVEGVTNVLRQNVEELLRRQELATNLEEKTTDMEANANMFNTISRKVEHKARCANIKMRFVLIGVGLGLLGLLIVIILWQTGAFNKK
ncbi:hypothetical protein EG68_03023 [Paragonimus skrjabini miyazakii]|uniref:Vesicle-associated membrane protein 7 n=1 Tax=Paragonimus skrjabini miyazakii TaxID=59628 RepID=A0A8S9Z2M5_9TREM|nr:hypothetical protein EG68_03023 [Paragonimus skrjabini miyazakii]